MVNLPQMKQLIHCLRQSITNLKFRDRIIFDGYPRNVEQAKNLELNFR